jgi:hypothetical protein
VAKKDKTRMNKVGYRDLRRWRAKGNYRFDEVKTELQEQALSRTGAIKRMCMAEIKGIDKALEIVKKEIEEE